MKSVPIVLLLLLTLLIVGCGKVQEETGVSYTTDMVYPVPYEPYSKNELTKDGKGMMASVNGTIPRGSYNLHHYKKGAPAKAGKIDEESTRAGRELLDPYETNKKSLKFGKRLYENYCLVCHGKKGKGDGPLIPAFRNPPSYSSKTVSQYKAGRIFHVITKGKGAMPSHAVQLTVRDRWHIVKYVQKLQKAKK